MILQAIVQKFNEDIQAAIAECETTRQRLLNEILQAEQKRDAVILDLSTRRDAEVLKEKLKDYPKTLTEGHQTCSVCGAEMRPYTFMDGEKKVKAWACQAGGLDSAHDIVRL